MTALATGFVFLGASVLDSTNAVIGIVVGAFTLVGLMAAWWYKWGRQMTATSEAILGRSEVKDRSGAVIQPAQPGMPAQVARLTEVVERLVEIHDQVADVTASVADLRGEVETVKQDVQVLKDAHLERVMTRVESTQAFAAIEAAAKATPEV